jgi:hypothetical protein
MIMKAFEGDVLAGLIHMAALTVPFRESEGLGWPTEEARTARIVEFNPFSSRQGRLGDCVGHRDTRYLSWRCNVLP